MENSPFRTTDASLFLTCGSFGSFKGIEFLADFSFCSFNMSGEITWTCDPFDRRFRGDCTEGLGTNSLCPVTTLALLDDRMALAAVEIATFSCHKCALNACLLCYALHLVSSGKKYEEQESSSYVYIFKLQWKFCQELVGGSV